MRLALKSWLSRIFSSKKLKELQYLEDLLLPNSDLIEQSGHSIETLKSLHVVPQRSYQLGISYCLVVADPQLVDCQAYADIGVGIYLAKEENIRDVWCRYELAI